MTSTIFISNYSPVPRITPAGNGTVIHNFVLQGVDGEVLGPFMAETFLYGLFFALFGLCFYILVFKKRTIPKRMLAATCLLFAASTVNVAISIYWIAKEKNVVISDRLLGIKKHIFVVSNAAAEGILINRCYMAWNRDKRILGALVLVWISNITVALIFGVTSSGQGTMLTNLATYLWLTFAINVFVTCLTAGKIMYTSCHAKSIFGEGIARQYLSAVYIIIESGLLYSFYILWVLVFYCKILDFSLFQIVGIIPTLIIVQVALSQHTSAGKTTNTTHIHAENFGDVEARDEVDRNIDINISTSAP